MHSDMRALTALVKVLSDAIVFAFTTPVGLSALGALLLASFALRVRSTLRSSAAADRASGRERSAGSAFLAVLDAALGSLLKAASALPTLAVLAAVAVSVVAVAEATRRVEEIAENERRIRELSAVVRNLERSVKVADLRVVDRSGGSTRFEIDFYDPSRGSGSVERRVLSIKGRDLYFDALVLNFDYSEIEAGRRVNIAIPYRVFSDEVAQMDGIPLGAADGDGIPYAWKRSDEDIYGIAPRAYRERLAELVALARSDAEARAAGIVRSVYGSAVHRKVEAGDRLEIRIEQSGGLTVKERFAF